LLTAFGSHHGHRAIGVIQPGGRGGSHPGPIRINGPTGRGDEKHGEQKKKFFKAFPNAV